MLSVLTHSPQPIGVAARAAWVALLAATAMVVVNASQARAQGAIDQAPAINLDSLVARALAANPAVRAARARAEAAGYQIAPAGARPDPMLMAGIQNFPVSEPDFSDFMTMKMVGVSQTIPYPGKLSLRARAASHEADAAAAELELARLETVRATKRAYYDLAYLDRAREIVERNRSVLADIIRTTEVRYGVGTTGQQDVLRVRVEAARLGEAASALHEERAAVLARLNEALDLPSATPLDGATVPPRIASAAVADTAALVRFVSPALGARAADSPLPPLEQLQDVAMHTSPALRAREAVIAAQAARTELARRDYLPDFDITLRYGQRDGLSDMITAMVSVPVPVQRRRKQNQVAAASRSEVTALEAEHHTLRNHIRAEVARLYTELEHSRTRLALTVKAILPQSRAALQSAVANYQVGRTDYLTLLDAQAILFNTETAYFRALSDFASTLAHLEQVVGQEVLP